MTHIILVGGGLANGLIADRLGARRPDVRVTLIEAGASLGANHTWSFHANDLTEAQRTWIGPLVEARWPAYDVVFPGFRRRVPLAYCSIASEAFDRVIRGRSRAHFLMGSVAAEVAPTRVVLADGRIIEGDAVVDGRGYVPSPHLRVAFQKFVGVEVRTARPHGLDLPIMMDATVSQHEGFRFIYTLPLAPDRLLVEDTYYADTMALDVAQLRGRIDRYIREKGWQIAETLREESGILPIGLGGDPAELWSAAAGVPRSGLRAALFHPTTGYSLPDAVRLADLVAGLDDLRAPAVFAAVRAHALRHWRVGAFYRLLDRMLFRAADPHERYRLFARFYHLRPELIARFYAGQNTLLDKARVFSGRPPVPVARALRCLAERRPAPVAL